MTRNERITRTSCAGYLGPSEHPQGESCQQHREYRDEHPPKQERCLGQDSLVHSRLRDKRALDHPEGQNKVREAPEKGQERGDALHASPPLTDPASPPLAGAVRASPTRL